MAKFIWSVFLVIVLQIIYVDVVYTQDQCIEGDWHKKSPSPETAEFKTCHAFKSSSCCNAKFTAELMANETRNLYNHSWHRCGTLSAKCQSFWVKQECFYQCSPKVYQWKNPKIKGALKGVPVCSGFCDAWFEACKDDQICVENVLEDYNFTVHQENYCPGDRECESYQAMYGNGKNLCEKMWGESYNYTQPNDNYSNCLMMDPSMTYTQATPKPTVKGKGITSVPGISLLAVILFARAFIQ